MTHALPSHSLTLPGLGFRWSHLATDEGPFGIALWLEVGPAAPLESASISREVRFHETGVVARLRARSHSLRPILVPGHLVVDGGRQARVIESSMVIPPSAELDVPVRCVEKGRWHAKRGAPPADN